MMCGVALTEFPHLTVDNFEHALASDDLLVHFFNEFLSLPSFPESLLYNQNTGLFEVASGEAEFVCRRITSVLHYSKLQILTGEPLMLAGTPPVDNYYSVCCLDREQGIQWILKERLPFFLQSDCHSEYRLAKMFEQEQHRCVQRRNGVLGKLTLSDPQPYISSQNDKEDEATLKILTDSHPEESNSAKQRFMNMQSSHLPTGQKKHNDTPSNKSDPEDPSSVSSLSILLSPQLQSERHPELQSSHAAPSSCNSEGRLDHLAAEVVKQVLPSALGVMGSKSQANTGDCASQSEEQPGCGSTDTSCQGEVCWPLADGSRLGPEGENGPEAKRVGEGCEKSREVVKQKNVLSICGHGICCHDSTPGLDRFKEFLRGTRGAKLFNLWMDIERLKAADSSQRKSRYLVLMRSWYLLSSSPTSLNVELLSRLGLSTSPCWTEEKLCSVQPFIVESLLHYWAPRFWTSHCTVKDYDDSPHPGLESGWCVRPRSGSMTLPPYGLDPLQPQSQIAPTQFHFNRSQLPRSTTVERLLQALSVDLCAGLYLTHFCEQSGNQLWKNAVHFWTDLHHYRELFYQDGLDPYRVQREAQLLYSTYLFSCTRRSVGVDEDVRREVYDHMMPAFEELFDEVEEHALNILLEPWTLLVNRTQESFHKLSLHKEARCVDSEDYRELQSLNEELEQHLKQTEHCGSVPFSPAAGPSTPLSEDPQVPDSLSRVSPDYQGYRLDSLFHHHHEVRHFMSFLQNQDAGIHLSCWLDLEQYRRTPQKDKAVRQKRASHIATKYLNRKYFFGDDSPATIEQQNDILHLAGGLERLKPDCVSNPVLVEVQDIVRSHIEREWLPLFLSSAEFTERQKHQPKPQTADRLSQPVYRQRRARRAGWKADNLWMSSSKEILLFRRVLLNPVACTQFQHFVSLKGDFLENDVLFWLEVQRYKDLCHSHCDEATIQQKISTIINCFINSSMPPALQIDIPPEQAQRILERRHELGPYIFREAQMSVLSELLRFWPEFQELRCSVEEESLLPLLQEKRIKHRARAQRQRRKEEEARAQEALVRPQSEFREREETLDEDEEAGEQHKGRSEIKDSRRPSRVLLTPTQSLSWSYSKYMAALKREEVLLRRQSQLEASVSTASVSSSDVCSVKSVCSKAGSQQASRHSSRAERQCSTYNRGLRPTMK